MDARGDSMRAVAAEQLVGAVAGDRDLDVLRHALRQEVGGHHAGERFVERAQNLPDALRIPGDGDRLLVVLGAIPLGDPACPPPILFLPFRRRPAGIGQREGLDPDRRLFGGQRGGQRRIDPAAQEEARPARPTSAGVRRPAASAPAARRRPRASSGTRPFGRKRQPPVSRDARAPRRGETPGDAPAAACARLRRSSAGWGTCL